MELPSGILLGRPTLAEIKTKAIFDRFLLTGKSVTLTARSLKINRATVQKELKKAGVIRPRAFRRVQTEDVFCHNAI